MCVPKHDSTQRVTEMETPFCCCILLIYTTHDEEFSALLVPFTSKELENKDLQLGLVFLIQFTIHLDLSITFGQLFKLIETCAQSVNYGLKTEILYFTHRLSSKNL